MGRDERRPPRRPVGALVLSFIAGVWMLAMAAVTGYGGVAGYGWGWGQHRMYSHGERLWWTWIGIVAGIIVLIGASALYARPADARGWGIVILAVSVLDLIFGAGGIAPGILGIIAGILAILWRP